MLHIILLTFSFHMKGKQLQYPKCNLLLKKRGRTIHPLTCFTDGDFVRAGSWQHPATTQTLYWHLFCSSSSSSAFAPPQKKTSFHLLGRIKQSCTSKLNPLASYVLYAGLIRDFQYEAEANSKQRWGRWWNSTSCTGGLWLVVTFAVDPSLLPHSACCYWPVVGYVYWACFDDL